MDGVQIDLDFELLFDNLGPVCADCPEVAAQLEILRGEFHRIGELEFGVSVWTQVVKCQRNKRVEQYAGKNIAVVLKQFASFVNIADYERYRQKSRKRYQRRAMPVNGYHRQKKQQSNEQRIE